MAKALRDTPWPVILLVLSFLCPTELSVYVGSARLPPHRALLLLLLPAAALALIGRHRISPKGFDAAFLAFAVWTVIVYIHHHGQTDGLQSGGALALDSFASFLVARAFVRDDRALRGTAGTLLLAVSVATLIALPEMLLGRTFVHDFLRDVTGYVHPTGVEKRLGLTRAYGVFDHPIHMGTFCAAVLAFAVYGARADMASGGRAIVIALAAFTSLSSAPLLGVAAQGAMIAFERATRGLRGRVVIAAGVIFAAFGAVSLVATRSPFAIIATGFTIDSWTGYYRLMIWQYGLDNVWANPWVGIGLNEWERPGWMVSSTVDSFWLVIAMRGGIPAIVLLVAAVALVARSVGTRMLRFDRLRRRLATGWMISLLALSLVGCTVHFWNVPFAFFFFFLGLGGCLADPMRSVTAAAPAPVKSRPRSRIRWVVPGTALVEPVLATPVLGRNGWSFGPPRWPVPVSAADVAAREPAPAVAITPR